MGFKENVLIAVSAVPRGKVVSYGQVAAACGSPRAARQVGWVLRGLDGDNSIPWWRVINNLGCISIKGNFISTPRLQKDLLEKERIKVSDDFQIDIEKYRYYYSLEDLKAKKTKKPKK